MYKRQVLYSEKGFSPLAEGRKITKDEDYLSNQLLYRNVHNYAIGHGTAADWDDNEPVTWISTATFPRYDTVSYTHLEHLGSASVLGE